jgi:ferrous iron transport protein A
MLRLLDVPIGNHVRMAKADGALNKKLQMYGLHAGDRLCLLRIAPLGGPLLVEVNGREIALGRSVAERIFVEAECGSH